jgi:hypothetical protein
MCKMYTHVLVPLINYLLWIGNNNLLATRSLNFEEELENNSKKPNVGFMYFTSMHLPSTTSIHLPSRVISWGYLLFNILIW